ncbi:bisphosphoglycerate mutase [Heterodontus francisci]|uniref:bisphosphoglycerate mutase n=1 Tax=Heterodontus francisci TaxID=7792 RepID=UPI00355BCC05
MMFKLVLLRHGEGAWNKENRFCSWVDQRLTPNGIKEAQTCGKVLKEAGFEFDLVFTSILSRSIETAWLVLHEMGQEWVQTESSWRLNERHYGALIGLNRAELAAIHGEAKVKLWRRSYDITPPPIDESHSYFYEIYSDRRYNYCDVVKDKLPKAESLKEVLDRLLPYWNDVIAPEVKRGKCILISAHGNSARALLKHLEGIPADEIVNVTLPTGVPVLLELDENLHPVKQHEFLGDQEAIQAAIKKVDDQGKVAAPGSSAPIVIN